MLDTRAIELLQVLFNGPLTVTKDPANKAHWDALIDLGFAKIVPSEDKPGAPQPPSRYEITPTGRFYIQSLDR